MTTMRVFRRSVPRAALFAAAIAACGGCAATDKVLLTSSRRLNSCDGQEAHPVGVRVYYLAATDRFSKADFEALWNDDAATLADDRLKVSDLTVVPQSQSELKLPRPKGAKAVGFVANFCKPGEGCWRAVVALEGHKGKLRLHLDEGCLSLD